MKSVTRPLRGLRVINFMLAAGFGLFLWKFSTQRLLIGSVAGNWHYSFVRDFRSDVGFLIQPLLTFLLILPYGVWAMRLSKRHIQHHEPIIVGAWFFLATAVQIVVHFLLYHIPIGQLVTRADKGSFYTISTQYSALDFIRNFNQIFGSLVDHGHTNMPGKTVFYDLLGVFTSSPEYMGYMSVAASNIGCVLAYYVAKELFQHRMVALYAMVLYAFLPPKIWWVPVLNTVSPVPMMLGLFLLVRFLNSSKILYLVFLGFACYLMVFFDPLVLFSGTIFLALLCFCRRSKGSGLGQVLLGLSVPAVVFLIVHAVLLNLLDYNIFRSLVQAFDYAANYFDQDPRSYRIWVSRDLFDFLVHSGFCQALLLVGCLGLATVRCVTPRFRAEYRPDSQIKTAWCFGISLAVAILCLDLSGLCRGEAVRLWIFFTPLMQILVAFLIYHRLNFATFSLVWITNLIQGIVTTSMVEW